MDHSHSWASETGTESVTLVRATPKGDGTDGKPGDVIDVETNVAHILVGDGMATYTDPWQPSTATGEMFKTGETEPFVPPPPPTQTAAAPAKA
jgi:hypothetical protein